MLSHQCATNADCRPADFLVHVYIMLPLPLLRVNLKQANQSAIQANRIAIQADRNVIHANRGTFQANQSTSTV